MRLVRLALVVPPVGEPVSLDEAKLHLRVTQAYEDALVDRQIQAAREFVEAFTGRACLTQTWRAWFDAFPSDDAALVVPKPPLIDVTAIEYLDGDGAWQTWSAALYDITGAADVTADPPEPVHPHAQAGEVRPVFGQAYPSAGAAAAAVRVTFTCGYGPAAQHVPAMLTAALRIKLADLFSLGRESRTPLTVAYDKNAIENLLGPFVIFDRWPPDVLTEGVA